MQLYSEIFTVFFKLHCNEGTFLLNFNQTNYITNSGVSFLINVFYVVSHISDRENNTIEHEFEQSVWANSIPEDYLLLGPSE